jgi:hypothetical protein
MPFNASAPAFTPRRKPARRPSQKTVPRKPVSPPPLLWPLEYTVAPPSSVLFVQRTIVEHFFSQIRRHNPADTLVMRMDRQFHFAIESAHRAASPCFTHAIVGTDQARNLISIVAWYENGHSAMFRPESRFFVPVTHVNIVLDATDATCGEIEYTYDHNFREGQHIEYGHVSFRDGWKSALGAVEFF